MFTSEVCVVGEECSFTLRVLLTFFTAVRIFMNVRFGGCGGLVVVVVCRCIFPMSNSEAMTPDGAYLVQPQFAFRKMLAATLLQFVSF